MEKNYLVKAKLRLRAAELLASAKLWCAAASNCYYALFNLMQAVVGTPPGKRWKHKGIVKIFCKTCREKSLLPAPLLEEVAEKAYELYELRRIADYSPTLSIDEIDVNLFLKWVGTLIREVEDER